MRQCSPLKYMACSCGMQNAPTGAGGGVTLSAAAESNAHAHESCEELAPHFELGDRAASVFFPSL